MRETKAYRVHMIDGQTTAGLETVSSSGLGAGDVLIQARYSSINYKDALGATGRGRIYKKFPIVGGIDVAGEVLESDDPTVAVGAQVLVTGCGLGETIDGGYSQLVRVPSDLVVPLPAGLSLFEAMAIGTAGFTAAICVHRMLVNDQSPAMGPVVVTGASGGVGSFAVTMFAALGFDVIAVSGKTELTPFLRDLGANEVATMEDLGLVDQPLAKARFGGAVDNLGGDVLAGLMSSVGLWGNIACVGLAGGAAYSSTVLPLILRGVSLLGISSNNCPMPLRKKLWQRLATDLKPSKLSSIVTATIPLTHLSDQVFLEMLERRTHGRMVVDCTK